MLKMLKIDFLFLFSFLVLTLLFLSFTHSLRYMCECLLMMRMREGGRRRKSFIFLGSMMCVCVFVCLLHVQPLLTAHKISLCFFFWVTDCHRFSRFFDILSLAFFSGHYKVMQCDLIQFYRFLSKIGHARILLTCKFILHFYKNKIVGPQTNKKHVTNPIVWEFAA
jgi:hypothetical protein